MKLKELLSYESMEKFMDRMDVVMGYLVCITGAFLVIVQLYYLHILIQSL